MHYVLLALVPNHVAKVDDYLTELLSPFDEQAEAALYQRETTPFMDAWHRREGRLTTLPGEAGYLEAYAAAANSMNEDGLEGRLEVIDGALYEWTTSNPQGKWDWWVVGGRWTGAFDEAAVPGDIESNSLPVPEIIERGWHPHALLTPTGKWDEHLWYGASPEPLGDWKTRCAATLEAHRDCAGVIVDYHS